MKKGITTYTEEELKRANSIISIKGEIDPNRKYDYYLTYGMSYISKDICFVLYKLILHPDDIYVNPFQFVNLLAHDLFDAAKKAKLICKNNNIIIDFDNKKLKKLYSKPNIISFGKYSGMGVDDVLEIDPKYIYWLANNYEGPDETLSKRLNIAKETAINNQNIKILGEFVGKRGEQYTTKGIVTYLVKYDNGTVSKVDTLIDNGKVKIVDDNGNIFTKCGVFKEEIHIGDRIELTARMDFYKDYDGEHINSLGGKMSNFKILEKAANKTTDNTLIINKKQTHNIMVKEKEFLEFHDHLGQYSINCPICGCNNVHVKSVKLYNSADDYVTNQSLTVYNGLKYELKDEVLKHDERVRELSFQVEYSCENAEEDTRYEECDSEEEYEKMCKDDPDWGIHTFIITYHFHKGMFYITHKK